MLDWRSIRDLWDELFGALIVWLFAGNLELPDEEDT